MAGVEKDQYDGFASLYDAIEELPQSSMYQELVEAALGDCSGKTVLDLGGGSGLHARKAVDRGAKIVDNVDISPGMLDMGKATESKLGREGRIRWFVGDMTKPLDHLPLERQYDIVMVNWTFDHAETIDELEMMWQNTADYTKKGGKLISIRMANPNAEAGKTGKYGCSFSDVGEIPGGLKYTYTAHVTPPFSCPATTMGESLSFEKSKLMAGRYGFDDFKKVPEVDMQVYKGDPQFWKVHADDPGMKLYNHLDIYKYIC